MKKIFMSVLVAATMVACGSKTSEANASEEVNQEVTTSTTENSATLSENTALAKYEEFVNKYIELYPKMMKGDADAIAEYTKLSEELVPLTEELSKEAANMSASDVEKYNELAKRLQDAVTQQ